MLWLFLSQRLVLSPWIQLKLVMESNWEERWDESSLFSSITSFKNWVVSLNLGLLSFCVPLEINPHSNEDLSKILSNSGSSFHVQLVVYFAPQKHFGLHGPTHRLLALIPEQWSPGPFLHSNLVWHSLLMFSSHRFSPSFSCWGLWSILSFVQSGRYGSSFIFLHVAGTLPTCMKLATNEKAKSWGKRVQLSSGHN